MKTGKIVLTISMAPDTEAMDVMEALLDQEVISRMNLILESNAGVAITDVHVVEDN